MKRFWIVFLLICLCFPLTALAYEPWSEEYYRAADSIGKLFDTLEETDATEAGGENTRVTDAAGLPTWYPDDVGSFSFYSDAEESAIEARLAELREELQKDIVIFTDTSAHGFTHAVYAADFYDFNGYGVGSEREGVCLMICMDPDDRGWWCCCTGPETMELYTERVANQIDDRLYDYMVSGDYGKGVTQWIEDFRRLYLTGSPLTPDWLLPGEVRPADKVYVRDDAGLFTDAELMQLEAEAERLSAVYGTDVAVYTAVVEDDRTPEELGALYYDFMGYDSKNGGLLLTIVRDRWLNYHTSITSRGAVTEKLTETNYDRLISRCESKLLDQAYGKAAANWISQAEHMLKTGRVPRSVGSWIGTAVLALFAGIIVGSVALSRAKNTMTRWATRSFGRRPRASMIPSRTTATMTTALPAPRAPTGARPIHAHIPVPPGRRTPAPGENSEEENGQCPRWRRG